MSWSGSWPWEWCQFCGKTGARKKREWGEKGPRARLSPCLCEGWKASKSGRCEFLSLAAVSPGFPSGKPVRNGGLKSSQGLTRHHSVLCSRGPKNCKEGQKNMEESKFFCCGTEFILPSRIFAFGRGFLSFSIWLGSFIFLSFFPLNSFKHFLDFHQSVLWSPSPGSEETLNRDLQIKSANCTSQQQKPLTWTHPLNNESLRNIRCWRRGSPEWTSS